MWNKIQPEKLKVKYTEKNQFVHKDCVASETQKAKLLEVKVVCKIVVRCLCQDIENKIFFAEITLQLQSC